MSVNFVIKFLVLICSLVFISTFLYAMCLIFSTPKTISLSAHSFFEYYLKLIKWKKYYDCDRKIRENSVEKCDKYCPFKYGHENTCQIDSDIEMIKKSAEKELREKGIRLAIPPSKW